MSGNDPIKVKTRNNPGPGAYNASISDFGDILSKKTSVVFGIANRQGKDSFLNTATRFNPGP